MRRSSGYGAPPPGRPDRASAIGVLQAAAAAGVDHIDTAQYYGPGVVNDLIREVLYPYPGGLAIVSKIAARRDELGAVLPFGIAPLEACEHDPPGTACPPGGPGHTRARFHRAEPAYYLTARRSTG